MIACGSHCMSTYFLGGGGGEAAEQNIFFSALICSCTKCVMSCAQDSPLLYVAIVDCFAVLQTFAFHISKITFFSLSDKNALTFWWYLRLLSLKATKKKKKKKEERGTIS